MQSVHVLADQEAQEAHALQLHQRHVGLCGLGILKGSVELGGQAPLLHRPDAMGAPAAAGGRDRESLEIKERENRQRETEEKVKEREIDIDKGGEVGKRENVVHNSRNYSTHPALTAAALGMALHWVMPGPKCTQTLPSGSSPSR